ncbi:MAG: OmpA family protein [Bacteroidetes bacterium]|nr:OmpA family protein [Bacteroidota bacterium]
MKTKYFFFGLALLLASCGNKMLKEAEQAYHNEQFYSAAKIYENVVKENPESQTMLHLADCYRHMNRHADAEKWYSKSINSEVAKATDKLNYAAVLKEEGKYQEAIAMFDVYLKTSPNDLAAKNQRASCDSKAKFETADPFFTIEKTDFGFKGSCFSPTKIGNDILVTASATTQTGKPIDNTSGNGFFDLYVISHQKNDLIAGTNGTSLAISVAPIAGAVNTNLHEGPAVVSPQNNVLFFTRSRMVKNKTGKADDNDNHLELCTADLVGDSWINIKSLPFNSAEYSIGQPAITSNGTRLFFISDMPGGFGGTDIYYSDFENGTWDKPVNAGKTINTNGNEMFPTIRMVNPGTDEFYFSSDGWQGAGGLDIFRCKMDNGIPVNPERMKAPINSSYDDFGLIFDANGNTGYFSTNRNNIDGKDDIYSFKKLYPYFFVKAEVRYKETNEPVAQIGVDVRNNKTGLTETRMTDDNGIVFFPADSVTNYAFTIRMEGYFTAVGSINTPGFKGKFNDTSRIVLIMDKIVINKPIRLENIYYDYNKWNIRPEAAIELDHLVQVMNDNPHIKIELGSHTDSRGSDKYNMTLSDKRAKSAVDYIVSKGISRDRITAKGYGESKPLNRCTNGVKCTEEEFQWNRRTEFKVTQILQ